MLIKAAIFSTSIFFFNYRHSANAYAFSSLLVRNKIPRSQLYIGIADDPAYNIRNSFPGQVFYDSNHKFNVHMTPNITNGDLSVNTFRSLLLKGPVHGQISPISKMDKNFILYLTGHGGNEFLKFHLDKQFTAGQFKEMVSEMKRIHQFEKLLIILDTCQAETFFNYINLSNVITISSSKLGESSISSEYDNILGVPLSDLFTNNFIDLVTKMGPKATFSELEYALRRRNIGSTFTFKAHNCSKTLDQIYLHEFFFK